MDRRLWAAGLVLLAAAGCQSSGVAPEGPSGRTLYESKCARCHALWPVHKFAPAQWPEKVRAMAARAGLTPEGTRRVIAYLQEASAGP